MALAGSQGKHVQVGWAFEATAGVPVAPTNFLRVRSFKMLPVPMFVPLENMDPSGQKLEPEILGWQLPFEIDFQPDVNTLARLLLHLRGFGSLTNPTAGVYIWTLRNLLSSDSPVSGIDTLSIEGDCDDDVARLLMGGVIEEMTQRIENGKFMGLTLKGMAAHFTHFDEPDFDVDGTTYLGDLRLRGRSDLSDVTGIKCTTGGALDGTALVKIKRAGAYGSSTTAITAGAWTRMLDETDDVNTISGDPLEPAEMLFTSGGTLSANDEWSVDTGRTKATATYSSRPPLTGVGAACDVGGVTYYVNGATIAHKFPRTEDRVLGSKFPIGFRNDVAEDWKITLTRKYTDRVLFEKLLNGASAAFTLDTYGAKIGSTAYRDRWRRYFANVRVSKAGSDPDKAGTLEEQIELTPFYDGSSQPCVDTLNCGVSALVG